MDYEYWSHYYGLADAPEGPSAFARFCESLEFDSVLDVGCGNLRDSIHFQKIGKNVIAIDQIKQDVAVVQQIRFLSHRFGGTKVKSLFDQVPESYKNKKTLVYARFLLHSLDVDEMSEFLDFSRKMAAHGAKIAIETRGPIQEKVDVPIRKGHRRRYLSEDELETLFQNHELGISIKKTGRGLAKNGPEDPMILRYVLSNIQNGLA